jgi:hypothetical protein
MIGMRLALSSLATLIAFAQVHFELSKDTPSPLPNFVVGYSTAARRAGNTVSVSHRYFFDELTHIYFGYDAVIEPLPDGTMRVSFYDLSIGPLDFPATSPASLDPTVWKKLAPPQLPEPKAIQPGDAISLRVYVDPVSARALVDSIRVPSSQIFLRQGIANGQMTSMIQTMVFSNASFASRTAVNITGPARSFAVEDAELRIQPVQVTVNDSQPRMGRSRAASGPLVWFYVPEHGRYVLSLAPHPELGFVRAGEVRGNAITFTVDEDKVRMECPGVAVQGESAYFLYVLHDATWAPTARGQDATVLAGSVSVRELAALARK